MTVVLDGELSGTDEDRVMLEAFQAWLKERGWDFWGWVSGHDAGADMVVSLVAHTWPEPKYDDV